MRIIFGGDIVLQDALSTKIGDKLKKLIDSAEIRVLNFEAPINTPNSSPINKSGPNIFQDENSPKWIEENGFNVISLANNHIFDYGKIAFEKTRLAFKNSSIIGAGNKIEAYKPLILRLGNRKIGFIAGTQKEFGCHTEITDEMDFIGAAWIGAKELKQSIIEARQQCDYLFLFAHAGVENIDVPLPQWKTFYHEMIELGVDCVVASHPHTPQGMEVYKNKYILYSLGNFVFQTNSNKTPPKWNNGLVAIIDIDDTSKINVNVTPIHYDVDSTTVELDTSDESVSEWNHLTELIGDPQQYNCVLDKSIRKILPMYLWSVTTSGYYKPQYSISFIKSLIKGLLKRKPNSIHFYNLFNCESHRWTMEYIIKHNLL